MKGVSFQGTAFGGNQPVTGSTIQLYAAGSTGYASAASPQLTTAVVTDSNGRFDITSDYTCPSATTQMYITSTQGNPGMAAGTNNPALAMMTALGNCGDLTPSTNIIINEASTVAAVWALAPFMSDYTHVGASSTNANGLVRAFLTAKALVNNAQGTPTPSYIGDSPTYNAPYATIIYPRYAINSLANALAACVNSDGSTSAGKPCALLFAAATPSGGAAPTETIGAALSIAQHPASKVSDVFNVSVANAPFQPTLSAAPNDWLLGITYEKFIKFFTDSEVDSNGTFWIQTTYQTAEAYPNNISAPTISGVALSGQGANGIAFDTSNNAWAVMSYVGGGPQGLTVTNLATAAVTTYNDASLMVNMRPAFDSLGNLWLSGTSSTPVFSTNGSRINTIPLSAGRLVADSNGNMWSAQAGTLTATNLSSSASLTVNNLASPLDIEFGSNGTLWAINADNTLAQFSTSGMSVTGSVSYTGGGLNVGTTANAERPLAVDGLGNVWVTNYKGNTISEFASNGTAISPTTGYGARISSNVAAYEGYYQVVAPDSIAIDSSGDVWLTGLSSKSTLPGYVYQYSITAFVGAAAPVKGPFSVAAATNTTGTRP